MLNYFSLNKKNKLTEKNLLVPLLQENLTGIKNISQNKINFLDIKKIFLTKKYFLFQENCSYFETIFLN